MSTTIPTPPGTVPAAPQRAEGAKIFWTKCDAFVKYIYDVGVYLISFVSAMTAVIGEIIGYRDAAADSAQEATAQVALATVQAARALSYAALAQVEAPPAWDAGASYSYPQTAVGSDGNTYRCLGVDVVGVDPTSGTTAWLQLTGSGGDAVYMFETYGGF